MRKLKTKIVTGEDQKSQLPLTKEDIFKLNFDYLYETKIKTELQKILRELNVSVYYNKREKNKKQLIETLLNTEAYIKLSREEIDKEISKKNLILHTYLPIENDNLFTLNSDYLKLIYIKKDLQVLAKKLGERSIQQNRFTGKDFVTEELVNMILRNSKYVWKTEEELIELTNKYHHDNKIEYYKTIHERLYSQTEEVINQNYDSPCLEFIGDLHASGYGRLYVFDKTVLTHRISYALSKNIFIEDIPSMNDDGELFQICHGNGCKRSCIQPLHLELKTHLENMYEDKIRDGTINRGENGSKATISEELAAKIKLSKNDGRTALERSEYFDVPKTIITAIDRGESWNHIPDIDGNIIDNTVKRKKIRQKRKENKEKIFTKEDYENALEKIKEITKESESIKEKVSTPCWLFQGSVMYTGYGRTRFMGQTFMTHILAYEATYGKRDLTGENKVIRHLCDTRACCNPEHLELSSFSQNNLDSRDNGSARVKLNEEKVREIKNLLADSTSTVKQIAEKFGVATGTIYGIKCGSRWRDVVV